jgi:hypothetical protein
LCKCIKPSFVTRFLHDLDIECTREINYGPALK